MDCFVLFCCKKFPVGLEILDEEGNGPYYLHELRKTGCSSLLQTGCTGFGWDSFFQSTWYGALFWIFAENRVDNIGMF